MSTSVTDTMTGAWSTGTGAVHDLAASAAELATEMATAAAEQLEDLPERVAGLASTARGRIAPPRRSRRPWLYLAIGAAAVLAMAWWWRRRSTSAPAVDIGPDGRPNPMRAHSDTAAASAGD